MEVPFAGIDPSLRSPASGLAGVSSPPRGDIPSRAPQLPLDLIPARADRPFC